MTRFAGVVVLAGGCLHHAPPSVIVIDQMPSGMSGGGGSPPIVVMHWEIGRVSLPDDHPLLVPLDEAVHAGCWVMDKRLAVVLQMATPASRSDLPAGFECTVGGVTIPVDLSPLQHASFLSP